MGHTERTHRVTPQLRGRLKKKIIKLAEKGATNRDCAESCRIAERTLYNWIATDANFAEDYAQAQAEARMKSIELIASSDDWRAHAWLQERRDPTNWGKADNETLAAKFAAFLEGVNHGEQRAVTAADADVLEIPAATESPSD